jgi:hypothetical protein
MGDNVAMKDMGDIAFDFNDFPFLLLRLRSGIGEGN